VLDSSLRKEIDSGKLLQAAQLVRQGLGFYNSSSSSSGSVDAASGSAGAHNPGLTVQLLQDPAAVTALASAVACLTKSWVAAFNMAHQQGSSNGSGSSGSGSGITPDSPEEFDVCAAATKRLVQLGLVSVLEWLVQCHDTLQQQQQQQQQGSSGNSASSSAAAGDGHADSSSSSSTRQVAASSLFLLLVVARSALLMQQTLQTAATQQQQQQQLLVITDESPGSKRASAQPLTVLQESDAVLQEVFCKCSQLLEHLQSSNAAVATEPAAAAAASTLHSMQDQDVVWENLLQMQAWLQQCSSSSHAAGPTAAAAAAAAAAAGGSSSSSSSASAEEEACRQLLGSLPLPELCNNLSCSNLAGISEAAAAKKRCSGCKIAR
jgi:hypothetical protein